MRIILLIVACLLPLAAPVAAADPCSGCHEAQDRAWQTSLHARALEDPLYLAMREWARQDAGEAAAAMCVNCHSLALAGSEERTSGVTCEVCHQGPGARVPPASAVVDPAAAVLAAPPVDADAAPHALAASPSFAAGEGCMTCHAELHNPHGVPLCTTGPEAEARVGGTPCLTCHMPLGSHGFPGTTPQMLSRAAQLGLDADDASTRLSIVNRGTGHALPTGSALRQVVLSTRFIGENGQQLAVRSEVFARVLADADGNAPAPPWRARTVHSDTRLLPQETRIFTYATPPGTERVVAVLVYHRAPAAVAERLGVADDPLLDPVEMTRVERNLKW